MSKLRAIGEHRRIGAASAFGWMKRLMGLERCRYRGLKRNAFDFVLMPTAYDVKKMVSLRR